MQAEDAPTTAEAPVGAAALEERAQRLPATSGVYLFKNARGKVLYVGKAQNLRARVRSYLRAGGDGRHRIPEMVERAADVEVVVTPSVKAALLLENELIKRHKPAFNVRLRDDKQYLGLRIDPREPWPRPTPVRRFREDGAAYFGPFTSSLSLREAISNLRRIFPLRSCSDPVFRDYARRGRPCIEFEMKRCLAPCCGLVGAPEYAQLVEGTVLFLRGRSDDLLRELGDAMQRAAAEERYEDAARLRDRIAAVEQTVQKQTIVGERAVDRDVFGFARRGGEVEIALLHVRAGRVVGHAAHAFSDLVLDDAEVFGSFLVQYYAVPDRPVPGEVWVPFEPSESAALREWLAERAGRRVLLRAPQRGAGREMIAMADANAELRLAQRLDARESVAAALAELQERLGLAKLPQRIECYDVSTLAGTLAVGSRVAFVDGQPDKNGYRRYRIREAPAGDDLACMREMLARRIAKASSDPLPDLLVVDGGRGQLGVAVAALHDAGVAIANEASALDRSTDALFRRSEPEASGQIAGPDVIGLSKERAGEGASARVRRSGGLKAEHVHLPQRKDPVLLPPSSAALLLLQRVRDEAHRFAIEFQRSLRQRAHMTSILEEIPGIGPTRRRALLRELGSLRAVREATPDALAAVDGISAADAARIRAFFAALEAPESADAAIEAEPALAADPAPPASEA
ncbi:MAG: excinuclease ABC subunit C [Proteobacteria bacterium]|nr:MAG: excinuclease ABC subunit C [Pseudomonadota bacterium]